MRENAVVDAHVVAGVCVRVQVRERERLKFNPNPKVYTSTLIQTLAGTLTLAQRAYTINRHAMAYETTFTVCLSIAKSCLILVEPITVIYLMDKEQP